MYPIESKIGLLLLLCVSAAAGAGAQDSASGGESGKVVIGRTTPQIKEILDRTRPADNRAIPTPKFNIHTADTGFILTIGGQINPILGYDIGNNLYRQAGAGISFVTAAIPVPAATGRKGDFYINPINGSVDLQVVGLQGTPNEISGYVKIGTNGITSSIVLQRAYITWRRFVAGMKLTLFQDDYACQPPTIDPEGPSGCVSTVAYEIAYKSRSYGGFRFAAAIDMPSYYSSSGYYRGKDYPALDGRQTVGEAEQLVPDIPVWVEYSFSQWNRIRLSAIFRDFAYRDLLADRTRHTAGWGAMLSGNFSPSSKLIFYYQFVYGKGIGNYIQDIAGKPISFVPSDSRPGHMTPSPMTGLNFGLSYNPTPRLQFNAMFSQAHIWDVKEYCNSLDEARNYRYALYGAVNCFYNISSYLQWGIEYLWGHRETWNIGGAHDSRIQTQLSFTF